MNILKNLRKKFRKIPSHRLWWIGLSCFALLVLAGFSYLVIMASTLPSMEQIDNRQIPQSTKIFDREHKVLLYEISGGEKRTVVPFSEIPQTLKDATIAIEDQNFYQGPPFSIRGILRAFWVNLRHGEIRQGGSTITQQLARNAFLTLDQTINRKVKELLLALRLSRRYTKEEILGLYLNEIPYGSTIYGVGTASSAYFNKPVQNLTLAESALLAAIPRAPSYYSPWGNHTRELFERQKLVLRQIRDLGKISQEEYQAALQEKITFQPQNTGIKAPHFVMAVQDYLVKTYGEEVVRTGGLSVTTTLDWKLQEAAEASVAEGAERNESLYGGKNAALVAQDPRTGQILAMVGSRKYDDMENEGNFNVATQGLRQPGSALKPFVYLTALSLGYTPNTILFDVPTEFSTNPSCPILPDFSSTNRNCFHPQNFDNSFRGPIPLRQALAQSINVTAVKTLYLAGMNNTLKTLSDFGITTLDSPSRYGLSLVLGGGEVRLADLVNAYATLAQEGVRHRQTIILEIKDGGGEVLESYRDQAVSVMPPEYPRAITGILTDINLRSGLFQSSLNLTLFPGHPVALKTGTTNDYRDAWAFGYTPSLAVGVWAGNNDNSAMRRQGSSILAAIPIWNSFLTQALKEAPLEQFPEPQPLPASKPILAGEFTDPEIHTILYYVDRTNPSGAPPADPTRDSQFRNWEEGIRAWTNQNQVLLAGLGLTFGKPIVTLLSPQAGGGLSVPVKIQAEIASAEKPLKLKLLFNDRLVQEFSDNFPNRFTFTHEFTPSEINPQNKITLQVLDQKNNLGEASVIVYP